MKNPHRLLTVLLPALIAVVVASASACVPNMAAPARTPDAYQAAAQKTTSAAHSAVSTAQLDAQSGADDVAFFPYLSISVSDAEDQLSSTASTFASIEPPPDDSSMRLRSQVTDALDRSLADVSAARIAIRRGDRSALAPLADALRADADELDRVAS